MDLLSLASINAASDVRGALKAMPQLADSILGTGIMRPSIPFSAQYFSQEIASNEVLKVSTTCSVFCLTALLPYRPS